MNATDRDRLLIEMHTNMEHVKKAVDEHGRKLDAIIPEVASHGTAIRWIRIVGGGAVALGAIVAKILAHE